MGVICALVVLVLFSVLESKAGDPPTIFIEQDVRPLPGRLDEVPVFNSNSPEIVPAEGILLSTFPGQSDSHLNYAFNKRFDIFTHHIAKADDESTQELHQGLLVKNPNPKRAKVKILRAASYLSQPDAPFLPIDCYLDNGKGKVFAGPGDRVMSDFLLKKRKLWLGDLSLSPGETKLLFDLPIPVRKLRPALNGRSTLIKLTSNQPIYLANIALFQKNGQLSIEDWLNAANNLTLSSPREKPATAPGQLGPLIYGRVSGVSLGAAWQADVTDNDSVSHLTIPNPGKSISYVVSTVEKGTWGTKQVQSAPLAVRYPGSAYQAHGNYGVHYDLRIPLYNSTNTKAALTISFQTPVKTDKEEHGLTFFEPPPDKVFFRGSIHVRYVNDKGNFKDKYIHLVQKRGQQGEPLVSLALKPGQTKTVYLDFYYPPDATPPQVITIKTLPPSPPTL